MRLRYTARASRQLRTIADYLAEKSPAADRRATLRIREVAEFLADHPHVGHKGALAGTREFVVPCMPYIIVNRIEPRDPETLTILAVYHGAQLRPGQTPPEDD
jgi:toxin ParE1/3/4